MSEESAQTEDSGTLLDTPVSNENNPLSTWRDSLPDDIKNDPSLQSFKDVDGLAKSYIHAQKMVGSEKTSIPREDWTESDWAGHYDKLGRPDTHENYKNPDGVEADLTASKKALYEAGLSSRQADSVLAHINDLSEGLVAEKDKKLQQNVNEARDELAKEYGRDAPHKLDVAKGVLQKFGSPELLQQLNDSGMANNIELIKALVNVGDLIIEDDVRGGRSTIHLDSNNNALSEINVLKGDNAFIEKLNNRTAIGHQEAVERWQHLHAVAFSENS